MPQFIEFPQIPAGEPARALAVLLDVFKPMPVAGEPFRELRRRLKTAELYSRERLPQLLRFFQLAEGEQVRPTPLILALRTGEAAARQALAERLWTVNPVLFATVYRRLEERVHSANELFKFLDSFAYPGTRITGPEVQGWVRLCQALGLFRLVGIRLGLSDETRTWFGARVAKFDVEDFLEEDKDEPAPEPLGAPAGDEEAAAVSVASPTQGSSAPAPVARTPASAPVQIAEPSPPASTLPSPLGRGRAVPTSAFAGQATFEAATRTVAVERITAWWAEQTVPDARPGPAAFGLDTERFQEDPEESLFRLAVAAALVFGSAPEAGPVLYTALDEAGALGALFAGTRLDGPVEVDAAALMTASVIARRVAEHPDLAADLEKADDADAAFTVLESAFGRGLFGLELFWMLRALATVGVIRREGTERFAALPERPVRNVLYRLGFLDTPYAADMAALRRAAAAATPFGSAAHLTLTAFAAAAGCRYGCAHRRRCDLPCRERADLD